MSGRKVGAGRRQVLAALTDHGPASRVELARRTGLSSSAVSVIAQELLDDGLLSEEPAAAPGPPAVRRGRGRPAWRLAVRPPVGLVVGVDIGNTHVRVAASEVGGTVLAELAAPLRGADSLQRVLEVADDLVRRAVARAHGPGTDEVRQVVLGLPAPVDHATGRIAPNNILPGWIDRAPGVELADRLQLEVSVENDANLGAVGERAHGAGQGCASLVYVKLSTGIGAGLVLDGRLFRGIGGTAGEVGHVQVDPAGLVCRCGSRGCLETVVSLPRLVGALAPVTDPALEPAGLAALVAAGHPGAIRVVGDAGRTVGQALASLVTVLNPEVLVVGGGWAPIGALLAERVESAVAEFSQPSAAHQVRVCAGLLGERAEVLGALTVASEIVTRRAQETLDYHGDHPR